MSIYLTDNQKQLIKWLVKKTHEGKLEEEFFVLWAFGGGGQITQIDLDEGEDHHPIKRSSLEALARADLLNCQDGKNGVSCALTGKAFTAVANDFQETGTLIADLQLVIKKLQKSLNHCKEREAKYGGNAPPELWNEIEDHEKAICLTRQILEPASEFQQELGSLNIDPDLKARLISILGEN